MTEELLVKATKLHIKLKMKREELDTVLGIRDLGQTAFIMKTNASAIPIGSISSTGFDDDVSELLVTTLIDYYKDKIADLEYDFKSLEGE